jgi:hypothetical protein
MRIWSLHPQYLDPQGLVALWRETLLAQQVLLGLTKGYKNHPQLDRFKHSKKPPQLIATYLWAIHDDAVKRGYTFDGKKICEPRSRHKLTVTSGQVQYEFEHLLRKLKKRNPALYHLHKDVQKPALHPMFKRVRGGIEEWEKFDPSVTS